MKLIITLNEICFTGSLSAVFTMREYCCQGNQIVKHRLCLLGHSVHCTRLSVDTSFLCVFKLWNLRSVAGKWRGDSLTGDGRRWSLVRLSEGSFSSSLSLWHNDISMLSLDAPRWGYFTLSRTSKPSYGSSYELTLLICLPAFESSLEGHSHDSLHPSFLE